MCTELYDRIERIHRSTRPARRRSAPTETAEAFATWQPFDGDDFAFTIPQDVPYSYEGDCVSYAWRVSVRVEDRTHDVAFWVLP